MSRKTQRIRHRRERRKAKMSGYTRQAKTKMLYSGHGGGSGDLGAKPFAAMRSKVKAVRRARQFTCQPCLRTWFAVGIHATCSCGAKIRGVKVRVQAPFDAADDSLIVNLGST